MVKCVVQLLKGRHRERGATRIEHGLIVAIIAAMAIVAFGFFDSPVREALNSVLDGLNR